jgi:hypothetical protein
LAEPLLLVDVVEKSATYTGQILEVYYELDQWKEYTTLIKVTPICKPLEELNESIETISPPT